ncbi:MAG: hypothetical protein N3E49_01905 [Bacteroidia bacterium]|nr:hypothetical protein [Bacteroidia bacterium]
MRWAALWLAIGWAQIWEVRAILEGQTTRPISLRFISELYTEEVSGTLQEGRALVSTKLVQSPKEVILSAPGYLPVRLIYPCGQGKVLDFSNPDCLHPNSAHILGPNGRAMLAAGELGSLPDNPRPVINAYDIELFLQAEKVQDTRADFNGDGRVDDQDFHLLLKNQALLLQTDL